MPTPAHHESAPPDGGVLVLLRHGRSTANGDGLFTGLLDAPLSPTGRAEAVRAADELASADLRPALWLCSPLRRATETAAILADRLGPPPLGLEQDPRLVERHYGALTGRAKTEVLAEVGEETFLRWRRSMDAAPPPLASADRTALHDVLDIPGIGDTESLADVVARIRPLWTGRVTPLLAAGTDVLVIAHGNSLRALCVVLDDLDDAEAAALNIPTARPLVYRFIRDRPAERAGRYLDHAAALAEARAIAREGGT